MRTDMTRAGEHSPLAIGKRLRLTRQALDLTQAAFCRAAKVSPSAYNQFEKGLTRPSIDAALALCQAYRQHSITLDWIYRGDPSGLRSSLADTIKMLRETRAG